MLADGCQAGTSHLDTTSCSQGGQCIVRVILILHCINDKYYRDTLDGVDFECGMTHWHSLLPILCDTLSSAKAKDICRVSMRHDAVS